MKQNAKRILSIILSIALTACLFSAYGESYARDCPECGRTGNTGNYCGKCAHPAPWLETAQTQQTIPSVPVLSEVYPGFEAHLRISNDNDFRVRSYAGPGEAFVYSGGYKPYQQKEIIVYYEEDGFVLADVSYQTLEERFVYLPRISFDSIGAVPTVSDLEYYHGITTTRIRPSWGPDNRFYSVESLAVDKGAEVKVFFQENGFVFAEYVCEKGTVRMWLPANNIEIEGAAVTYSGTPIAPAGQSSF